MLEFLFKFEEQKLIVDIKLDSMVIVPAFKR